MDIYVDVDIFVYADQVRSIKNIEPQTRAARQFKVWLVFSTLKYKYFLERFFVRFLYLQPPHPNSLTPSFDKNIYTDQLSIMSS